MSTDNKRIDGTSQVTDELKHQIQVPHSAVATNESDSIHSDHKEESDTTEPEEMVYDKGYCWVVCFACFLLNGNTWGMNSGFAIYFSTYLNEDTFPGATKIDYAAIGGLAFGACLIFTPFINYFQGIVGVKTSMIIGNCAQFASLMLASFCTKLWQLYLTQGLLQSFGLGLISLPAVTILPQWFRKRRVLAGGIASGGSGAFGVAFNLGMQKVVQIKDPFWGLRAQAIISFVLVWVAIILLKTRDKQHNVEFSFFDSKVVRMYGFYFALMYGIFCMLGYVITLYTVVNFTTSLGYTPYQGSIAAAMIQLGSCVGRPLVGLLSDKFGATTMAAICYLLSGVFCLSMWIPARNYATIIAFALMMGSIMGTVFGTFAPIVARLVGIRKMNITFSMLWISLAVGSLVSPVIGASLVKGAGGTVDPTQYVYCSLFAGVSFVICSACLFLLRGYILARDKVIESTNVEEKDIKNLELDSDTLVNTRVPVAQTLKYTFLFGPKTGKA